MTPRTPIEIPLGAGSVLRGEACQGGDIWAVLAHDQGEDLDRWQDVPEQLAAYGVSAVAIDLRGHGGSDGEPDATSALEDLELAIDAARLRRAAAAVVAAGATATAALRLVECRRGGGDHAAGRKRTPLAGAPPGAAPDRQR